MKTSLAVISVMASTGMKGLGFADAEQSAVLYQHEADLVFLVVDE
jgi:hypothetical protein